MKKYILGIILALFIGLGGIFNSDTMALDSDYKNNLLKIDVTKVNDGNYKIDLFTQKPYNEPIKVIKKSDTNYYVLLPETYHSITSVASQGDVSKVDVKLFPYAGQDLNNGYTKINISTSKPVTFTANVKTAGTNAPKIDAKKLAQLDKAFEGKQTTSITTTKTETAKNTQKQTVKTETKPVVKEKDSVKIVENKTSDSNLNVQTAKPTKPYPAKTNRQNEKIATNTSAEIEIVAKPKVQDPPKQQEIVPPKEASPMNLEEVLDAAGDENDEQALEKEAQEQGLTELATGEQEVIPELSRKEQIKNNIRRTLKLLADNFLIVIVIILLFMILLLLAKGGKKESKETRKQSATSSLESLKAEKHADLESESIVNGESTPQNIPQSNKQDDSEFSVYEAGHVEVPENDAILPSTNEAIDNNYEPQPLQTYEAEETPIAVATIEKEEKTNDEADVLASESFGNDRGLCLVNFDGDIALIGYIGDEVFVIQNFGKITLINPGIQVRIAEQNDNDTIYIVKTANSKLMVRETKTFIGLEMVM